MAWARLDDSFHQHPKIVGLSDQAFRLHVSAICYANANLTDGLIQHTQLPLLLHGKTLKIVQDRARELVDAGVWSRAAAGHFQIHDFLIYNKPRSEIIAKRQANAKAGAMGAASRWHDRQNAPVPVPVPVPIERVTKVTPPLSAGHRLFMKHMARKATEGQLEELEGLLSEHGEACVEWVLREVSSLADGKRTWKIAKYKFGDCKKEGHGPERKPYKGEIMEPLKDHLQPVREPRPLQPSTTIEPTCIECRDSGRAESSSRLMFPGRRAFCHCEKGDQAWEDQKKRQEAMRQRRLIDWLEKAGTPSRYLGATFATYPNQDDAGLRKVVGWALPPDVEGMSDDEENRVLEIWLNEQKDGMYLYGEYGTGKTGLAVAAMKEIADSLELRPMFLTTTSLLDRIRRSFNGEKDDVLEQAQSVPLLVLDDIGAERVTEWVEERLFALINERYNEQRTLICTSNMSPEDLAGHIGERTAWRLMEMCAVIKLDGKNLRLRSTQK